MPRHLTSDPAARIFIYPLTYEYYPDHLSRNLGVYRTTPTAWSIYYEKKSPAFQEGNHFACYIAEPSDTVFTHVHIPAEQSFFKRSYMDHPSLNNNPSALVFLTHNWSTHNVYNDQFSFMDYDTSSNQWFIQSFIPGDEFTDVPANAAWNVLVKSPSTNAYIHTAAAFTLNGSQTTLDHPLLNNNPNALLLVTHESTVNAIGMQIDQTQARYLKTTGQWVLESLTGSNIRENSRFHIFIAPRPNTPEPVLSISQVTNTLIQIQFPTEFGYRYQLQAAPQLGLWQDEGLPFPGNGTTISYPTSTVLSNNSFRAIRSLDIF